MSIWIYEQESGKLFCRGEHVASGYSGFAEGRNNPAMEHVRFIGPIPRGTYRIGYEEQTGAYGPVALPLTPCEGTMAHGRRMFMIRSDSRHLPGTAPHCPLVLPQDIRMVLAASIDRILEVR
jgi:hypothetical protein